jgi:hypothetical protein
LPKALQECVESRPTIRVSVVGRHQHSDVAHRLLLRPRHSRPSDRRTTQQTEKFSPLHASPFKLKGPSFMSKPHFDRDENRL